MAWTDSQGIRRDSWTSSKLGLSKNMPRSIWLWGVNIVSCEWENEEENCKRECMMSYYTFDIMENEQKKQEVQKFCEEQLGWRITK